MCNVYKKIVLGTFLSIFLIGCEGGQDIPSSSSPTDSANYTNESNTNIANNQDANAGNSSKDSNGSQKNHTLPKPNNPKKSLTNTIPIDPIEQNRTYHGK